MSTLFTRLLLATEHCTQDVGAESLALAMAGRCQLPLKAVYPLAVNLELEASAPALAASADAQIAQRREALGQAAAQAGVAFDIEVHRAADTHQAVLEMARSCRADIIITRRRGKRGVLANLLVGEMVSKVVAHAPCSVLMVPVAVTALWQRQIVCGFDPNEPDLHVVDLAARLARDCGLPLHVVSVASHAAAAPEVAQRLAQAAELATRLGARVSTECRVGRSHQELLAAAEARQADLIIVGRHGQQSITRAWLGGTAQKTIGLANCPVLVVVQAVSSTQES